MIIIIKLHVLSFFIRSQSMYIYRYNTDYGIRIIMFCFSPDCLFLKHEYIFGNSDDRM